jgi:hypothetical protein
MSVTDDNDNETTRVAALVTEDSDLAKTLMAVPVPLAHPKASAVDDGPGALSTGPDAPLPARTWPAPVQLLRVTPPPVHPRPPPPRPAGSPAAPPWPSTPWNTAPPAAVPGTSVSEQPPVEMSDTPEWDRTTGMARAKNNLIALAIQPGRPLDGHPGPGTSRHASLPDTNFPPIVVRFLLVCGVAAMLGLIALIFLEL